MSSDRNFARNYYYRLLGGGSQTKTQAGQQVFVAGSGTPGRYQTFIVPDGIYFLSAVVVSETSQFNPALSAKGYVACRILRGGQNGSPLLSTSDSIAGSVGGGNGGQRGGDFNGDASNSSPHANAFASGGAGGYTGNGGRGANGIQSGYGTTGQAGAGGGGGGGAGPAGNPPYYYGSNGGPVGLMGQGTNGAGGSRPTDNPSLGKGGTGSAVSGPYVGAGSDRSSGGDLRWRNNIPVVPGEVLTIDLGSANRNEAEGIGAGCRVMYGDSRSYPSNAQNTIPQGQVIIVGNADYAWQVPANVTSICACAQQDFHNGADSAVVLSRSGTVLVRAFNGARVGDGGGDGGAAGDGGGGAGGYDGNGGAGGGTVSTGDGAWEGQAGAYGTNSGQRGGDGSSNYKNTGPVFGGQQQASTYTPAQSGRSIGIKGKLADGTYNDPKDGNSGGAPPGYTGGALAWRNNIAVTPGEMLNLSCRHGRIRIIYGPSRSYPNNAIDL